MKYGISHDRAEESLEAKAEWFSGFSVAERLEMLDEFYELAVGLNPHILECKDAAPIPGRIQIIPRTGH